MPPRCIGSNQHSRALLAPPRLGTKRNFSTQQPSTQIVLPRPRIGPVPLRPSQSLLFFPRTTPNIQNLTLRAHSIFRFTIVPQLPRSRVGINSSLANSGRNYWASVSAAGNGPVAGDIDTTDAQTQMSQLTRALQEQIMTKFLFSDSPDEACSAAGSRPLRHQGNAADSGASMIYGTFLWVFCTWLVWGYVIWEGKVIKEFRDEVQRIGAGDGKREGGKGTEAHLSSMDSVD